MHSCIASGPDPGCLNKYKCSSVTADVNLRTLYQLCLAYSSKSNRNKCYVYNLGNGLPRVGDKQRYSDPVHGETFRTSSPQPPRVGGATHPEVTTPPYVITELLQSDLHKIIVSPQHLSADHIKVFLYQILRASMTGSKLRRNLPLYRLFPFPPSLNQLKLLRAQTLPN
ncbi:unnamed protein product [Danaus chrysippus]|uniref:(African queen) hypothetical protein n=1 Tax=Danaus chrysippus TaxID=151541 RepID=A0A8J2WDG4_9NEOP|nr:unnamed protein product [Danaus chrysippus]